MTLGEVLGYVSAGAAILYGIWDRVAKGRETDQTVAQRLREELVKEIDRRDRDIQGLRDKVDRLDHELDEMKFQKRFLMEYLKDVAGAMFDYEWVKRRAEDLLERLKP